MTGSLHLDYNYCQRSFDDLTQTRIKMEVIDCQEIFTQVERNKVTLIWSLIHQDETLLCPFLRENILFQIWLISVRLKLRQK